MKAMIFAAGLGTRLQPLTETKPKALIEVGGKTLLEINIQKLVNTGASPIVVNVHHFADMISAFLRQDRFREIPIFISDESEMLLDTGGGLKNAAHLLKGDEPILLHNVDIISGLDLKEFADRHKRSGSLATLAVRRRATQRYLMFDPDNNLTGWKNIHTGEERIARPESFNLSIPFAFSGIQIISHQLLNLLGHKKKFSIIDTYLNLADKHEIKGFDDSGSFWIDTGKPDQLNEARKLLC